MGFPSVRSKYQKFPKLVWYSIEHDQIIIDSKIDAYFYSLVLLDWKKIMLLGEL